MDMKIQRKSARMRWKVLALCLFLALSALILQTVLYLRTSSKLIYQEAKEESLRLMQNMQNEIESYARSVETGLLRLYNESDFIADLRRGAPIDGMRETWNRLAFRTGSFSDSKEAQTAYNYNKLIYDNTYEDTFSLEQTDCDARMVLGEAAMKVSGSWSIQNFLDIDENFDFGIFPFPNQTGDSKLIFEPNITIMTSASTEHQDAEWPGREGSDLEKECAAALEQIEKKQYKRNLQLEGYTAILCYGAAFLGKTYLIRLAEEEIYRNDGQ